MHILMTGGTGLIGRALCPALKEAGHDLTVLSRRPETVPVKCGPGVAAIGRLDQWEPALHFDAVINLAGEPIVDRRWTVARKRVLTASRVDLTRALIDRIRAAHQPPAVLISGSAVGIYGNGGDTILFESAPIGGDFGARLCADWESAALAAEPSGVRVCLLRTGLVLSRDGGFLTRMLPSFRLGLGARIGDGRQWMSWIHIDDYVALVLQLLREASASGAYNMTAPEPVTNAEFTQMLARVLGRSAPLSVPAWGLRLALGEMAELLTGGQRALPAKAEALGFQFAYRDLESALQAVSAASR